MDFQKDVLAKPLHVLVAVAVLIALSAFVYIVFFYKPPFVPMELPRHDMQSTNFTQTLCGAYGNPDVVFNLSKNSSFPCINLSTGAGYLARVS